MLAWVYSSTPHKINAGPRGWSSTGNPQLNHMPTPPDPSDQACCRYPASRRKGCSCESHSFMQRTLPNIPTSICPNYGIYISFAPLPPSNPRNGENNIPLICCWSIHLS
ncbi:hypothetical protein GMDG_07353 [Pseudogymnoascus destructans 20631-21]|uniref:Uncharacterized protein n=1 Tax=Pseudogymnoascus destructans (strain ATCC MYA-4855 / 20631-21) TaxID=658429 RepID=L8FWN9_PSED2|nr:hypothetical protein GMDG_07353 [Pseudogymnoascus destructans 20631-21]